MARLLRQGFRGCEPLIIGCLMLLLQTVHMGTPRAHATPPAHSQEQPLGALARGQELSHSRPHLGNRSMGAAQLMAPDEQPAPELGLPNSASATEHGRHHREMPNLGGAKIGHMSIFEPSEHGGTTHESRLAIGLFYERVLLPGWLEVELTGLGDITLEEPYEVTFLPFDLHFKKPFHPSPSWTPYVGLGPAMDVTANSEPEVFFGGSLVAGAYLWFKPHFGLDLELDYNFIREEGEWVHQIMPALGPVVRW